MPAPIRSCTSTFLACGLLTRSCRRFLFGRLGLCFLHCLGFLCRLGFLRGLGRLRLDFLRRRDLLGRQHHLASSSFELGNPDLGKETSRHLDVGLRKNEGAITWGVTLFYTQFDDFIFLRDTDVLDSESELPIFAFDQQDADIFGIEAEIFAPLAEFGMGELDLRLYTDYVEGELESGDYLPRLPPLRYGARLQFHTARLLTGVEATRYDRQTKTAPFETPTDGYTMVNADLRWLLPDTRRFELSLFFKASNLLDEDARRHTSMVKAIAPLPGRNYSVAFRAGF
jgi:iron complex outermembrane receptor protein